MGKKNKVIKIPDISKKNVWIITRNKERKEFKAFFPSTVVSSSSFFSGYFKIRLC